MKNRFGKCTVSKCQLPPLSRITSAVTEKATAWQNRPLESLYLIVWMDGIMFKVRENSRIINKTIYLAVGLNREGRKEVLGMWLGKINLLLFG